MNRKCIDWLAGVAVATLAVVLYLSATPSGRALTLTAVGFAPGMSRAEVEARIGGPGVASGHFHTISVNIRPGGPTVPMEEMMDRLVSYLRAYRGPVFVVEVEYSGRRHPKAVDIRLRAGQDWVLPAGLTAVLVLAFGTAELTRRCRRALAMARYGSGGASGPHPSPHRSWDIRWRDTGAGLGAVAGIAVLAWSPRRRAVRCSTRSASCRVRRIRET